MKSKLIMLEGIPGSGKTTTARKLAASLKRRGIGEILYAEGCLHPANLDGYCIMKADEAAALCEKFPEYADRLTAQTLRFGEYSLIQRQKSYTPNSRIFKYLQPYAVWDSGLDFALFERLHIERWKRFAEAGSESDAVSIFECAYLQDHITELMLYYEKPPREICEYLKRLGECVVPLRPFIVYLTQSDVAETIRRVAEERVWEGGSWVGRVTEMICDSPYGRTNGLTGYDGFVEFFRRRKEIDLLALESAGIDYAVIENNAYEWKIAQKLALEAAMNAII